MLLREFLGKVAKMTFEVATGPDTVRMEGSLLTAAGDTHRYACEVPVSELEKMEESLRKQGFDIYGFAPRNGQPAEPETKTDSTDA